MEKDNKNTELDNRDKKLHISDVMNCILNDLQIEIDKAKEMENKCGSKGYFEGVISNQASIRGLESAVKIVKKYCS
jgi:hypothetical protein